MLTITALMNRGFLTGSELAAVFRHGLDEELGLSTTTGIDDDIAGAERTPRILVAMYKVAARIAPDATEVPSELLDAHTAGFSETDRRAVVLMIKILAPQRRARIDAAEALASMAIPVNTGTVRAASDQLLRARAEAQSRAMLATHPDIVATGDPLSRLLDDALVASVRIAKLSGSDATPPRKDQFAPTLDSPFLVRDTRRLSEVVEATIAGIQRSGDWNADVAQRRRVISAFGWITGDKHLCDYEPRDAELFANTLERLPIEFRWGSLEKGNMSRPVAEVMAEVDETHGTKRGVRTLNRDLTTLSRFARELMKTAWKPRHGKDPIVDFAQFASRAPTDDPDDPDRMPYTSQQLVTMFSSPIYTGGGGCARRLKVELTGTVWQDSAYWVPLLLAYGVMSREEACGAECEDFVFDVETPFVAVVENMTKSKDGKTRSGLKRKARRRMIPLHPELLRLGLRAYIERIEADGHPMAFPELYQGHVNAGGKRFYASAGRYILDYVDGVTPLLRTSSGKRADLHSLRTTGGSALENSEAKQLVVDDIMGHAREGTGPRKYSKAWFMKGRAAILAKRLEIMVSALPVVTNHLQPAPVRLLPLTERSRTGSGQGRVSRRKN